MKKHLPIITPCLQSSLKNLIVHVAGHHRQNVILIIDEYDTLIHEAYINGYYNEAVDFMRIWLGGAIKDQPAIFKSILTGILRVAKESLFSGLNNFAVFPLQDVGPFEDKFGFSTEYLDVGGGFPSRSKLKGTYFAPDVGIPSIDEYADQICDALHDSLRPGDFPKLIIESGRAMVDESGYMITSVTAS